MPENQAAGANSATPNHELARILMETPSDDKPFDSPYIVRKFGVGAIIATREELERSKALALAHLEPKLDGSLSSQARKNLGTIGCAMRPDLTPAQSKEWVDSVMVKLGDLPPHVLTKATARAIHVPFQFPSEVEAKVRQLAAEHLERIDLAIWRAKTMEQEIWRALYQPKLPAPPPRDEWPRHYKFYDPSGPPVPPVPPKWEMPKFERVTVNTVAEDIKAMFHPWCTKDLRKALVGSYHLEGKVTADMFPDLTHPDVPDEFRKDPA